MHLNHVCDIRKILLLRGTAGRPLIYTTLLSFLASWRLNIPSYEKNQLVAIKPLTPAKNVSPFLSTAPLQYAPKILLTQATIDCLINNKTKNALHNEAVIL